jgi:hypothetical protein
MGRRKAEAPHPALQCRTGTADEILMKHSNADSLVHAAAPEPGNLRIPVAVLDHLPDLHGAEFKVLLVLGHHQSQGGGRDKKPFSYTIPQIQKDTGLCPRAISKAISRLDKHHLILRVAKYGALPNRYRVLLEPAAPLKIPLAKKPARASKRARPAQAVEVNLPVRAAPPQKRAGGRRRKDSPPLRHVERANLFEGLVMDADQPDQAKADPIDPDPLRSGKVESACRRSTLSSWSHTGGGGHSVSRVDPVDPGAKPGGAQPGRAPNRNGTSRQADWLFETLGSRADAASGKE